MVFCTYSSVGVYSSGAGAGAAGTLKAGSAGAREFAGGRVIVCVNLFHEGVVDLYWGLHQPESHQSRT